MKKVLITATMQSHIYYFHKPLVELLHSLYYEVHIAAKDDLSSKEGLVLDFVDKIYNLNFTRRPISWGNISSYRQLKKLIADNQYDIIHCNTPVGGVVTRLASRKLRKRGSKVIYTAHGFHFYKGAALLNWLIYYPIEWFLSFCTDILITINNEDYIYARKHLHAKKTVYIPGVGLDLNKFNSQNKSDIIRSVKRREIGIPNDKICILSVGELNKNKNHRLIIKAISDIPNIYYIIAGNGKLKNYLLKLAQKNGSSDRIKLLGHRQDIVDLCKIVDIFCHPSRREGLPVACLEAMASGLPIIASDIRGIRDFSINGITGFLCQYNNKYSFIDSISALVEDKQLREKIGENNKVLVEKYSADTVAKHLRKIYETIK